ncbi:uncharacterized protein [Lepeophtheirus salmonis]|uniref:uncharacterized protein isoform X2 n=1 Tax=Lepeophtheirus salmonis TaxID=72036 RepID=UPI001AE86613|nr:matrix metalloproteinase-9-like isoform X2 [Lepeophtheirus salmonis]
MAKRSFSFSNFVILVLCGSSINVMGNCATTAGDKCVFPFKYRGNTYQDCTSVDYNGVNWCPTSLHDNGEAKDYGDCASSCSICKATDNLPCKFPFVYGGRTYNECTNVDYGSTFWCATSVGANNDLVNYGICRSGCTGVTSGNGCTTTDGNSCIFPFVYNGKTYSTCTVVDNSGTPWCATSVDASRKYLTFGNCGNFCSADNDPAPTTRAAPITKATSSGLNIKTTTPKSVGGKNGPAVSFKTTATPVRRKTTVTNFKTTNLRKTTPRAATVTSAPTRCSTSTGENCQFPFSYDGQTFEECTTVENGDQPWCATYVNERRETEKWGNCEAGCPIGTTVRGSCPTTNGQQCRFPFVYRGKTYNKCTNVDYQGVYWCATSLQANNEMGNYGICNGSCPGVVSVVQGCTILNGTACQFPFKYLGNTYNTCTTIHYRNTPWCATSIDARGNYTSYGICRSNCQVVE